MNKTKPVRLGVKVEEEPMAYAIVFDYNTNQQVLMWMDGVVTAYTLTAENCESNALDQKSFQEYYEKAYKLRDEAIKNNKLKIIDNYDIPIVKIQ